MQEMIKYIYGIFDENYNLLEDYVADSIDIAIQKISKYEDIGICGSGAVKYKSLLLEKFPNIKFCEENFQSAENAGKMGYKKFLEGNITNSDLLMPMYLRKSQAERLKK